MKSIPRVSALFPLLLVIYEISIYLSNDMYLPALPDMMHDLSLSATHAQLTITMWFLGSAITPLFVGALADRYGRRPVLLIGGLIYIISTILCAVAINEYSLLFPRIIEGAMVATMMVGGYACIHELYDHKEAIRVLAIMGAVSVLAPAFGPLLGAIILLFGNWRWIFWIIAIFSTTMIIALYYFMPETLTPEKQRPLHFKQILHNYWEVLANKQFLLLMAILGFNFAGFIGWVTTGPLLVIDSLRFSTLAFGWMQASVFIAYIIGSTLVNYLLKTKEANHLVYAGLIIALLSALAGWACTTIFPQQFYLFLLSVITYSFGSALCFAPLNRLIIETSQQPMGIRVAMFTTGLMGAGVVGSAVTSVIYNGTSASLAMIMSVCVMASCLLQFIQHCTIKDQPNRPA